MHASNALSQRVGSIDVYRGFVMFLMMAEVLALSKVAEQKPGSGFWQFLAFHQSHIPWVGCTLHDLIQPSFTFLVGVVMPYSISRRISSGASFGSLLKHTLIRSFILIALGIFLRSLHSEQTNFTFEDTLTQIGLGYTFLFLISYSSPRMQVMWLAIILAGYWLAFAMYPLPPNTFDYESTGVSPDWEYNLDGFAAHWNKNTNLAWAFDRWFLNLFPRPEPFEYNGGGYTTLSFIPTLGTMLLGLLAGNNLRRPDRPLNKLRFLIVTGSALIIIGLFFHLTNINPIVKRIWTPAWTLYSGGLCFLLLALFYSLIDITGTRSWSFFFMVIGTNSIAAYVIADGFAPFITKSLYTHLGKNFDQLLGPAYHTLMKGSLVLALEWLILYWMFRKKIFIKI